MLVLCAARAWAEDAPEAPEAENGSDGYSPRDETVLEALKFNGYIDVGFAAAQGDGTSFAEGDTRLPADYGVDTFATAVNLRNLFNAFNLDLSCSLLNDML